MSDRETSTSSQIRFAPGPIFNALAGLYPYFIAFYFFLAASFNYKVSGFVFLAGIGFLWMTGYLLSTFFQNMFPSLPLESMRGTCSPFASLAVYKSTIPEFQVALCFFTLVVVFLPMTTLVQSNPVINIPLIGFMGIMTIANIIWLLSKPHCTSAPGVIGGALMGTIVGALYFLLLFSAFKDNRDNVLFFNEILSDNVVCSRPSKTMFKCSVTQGGNLIGQTTF
jgi:hypothetical protein